jgi:hypothetical protein
VLGFFSFTEVTDPTLHRAYNEWHQLDHLPAQFELDGITFGQRWVCTPECQRTRVAVSPLLQRCHYMTLYLMQDEAVLAPFAALAERLRAEDRFFEARHSHLSGPFTVTGRWAAPRVRVAPEVVPFRPSTGIYVAVGPRLDGGAMSERVYQGVAGVWSFMSLPPGLPDRQITVAFIDGDLASAAGELGRWCLSSAEGLEWAGALEGIDAYRWDWFDRLTPQ